MQLNLHLHDVKEIWGAGEQQVRNVWSSIGSWNVCGWLDALVELECWDNPERLVQMTQKYVTDSNAYCPWPGYALSVT